MDLKRIVLYAVAAILGIFVFNTWMHDYPPAKPVSLSQQASQPSEVTPPQEGTSYSPSTFNPTTSTDKSKAGSTSPVAIASHTEQWVQVKTDVLIVSIDPDGGNIVSATLPKYSVSLQDKQPIQILSADPTEWYVLQSGLTNTGKKGEAAGIRYTAAQKEYTLSEGQNALLVTLTGRSANGLSVVKTYAFKRGSYAVQLNTQILNQSGKEWSGSLYTQISRKKPDEEHSHFYTRSYDGAAISSAETPYEKLSYKSLDQENLNRATKEGWIAMQQHYFLSAWIPQDPQQMHQYYSHVVTPPSGDQTPIYTVGFVSPQMTIAPNAKGESGATFYVGPEIAKQLRAVAPNLDRTIDYGWLWFISILLFWIMDFIHALVRNWGWTIVITTIIIKIVFYWFSAKSFRSMARLREMQPKLALLKERHGDDRQALSKATMELYRKEKINPLGGCLPMVIQIPVFIAFYYVIIESVQLRQAPFILWIHDLSLKDPYYVFPILMGLSMLLQQWLSPASPNPTQQKMMWILPIVFTVFFVNFPAGLVLYWLTNNLVQALQQWYVNKTYEQHKAKVHAKRTRKKN